MIRIVVAAVATEQKEQAMNKPNTMPEMPKAARAAARRDSRIVEVSVYPDGWVPNSYRYRCPGEKHTFRKSNGRWKHVGVSEIDRKRSGGHGPEWVAHSERGGRLASG